MEHGTSTALVTVADDARGSVAIGFDYEALPADVAFEAKAAADRIRRHHRETVESIAAIGNDLLAMKERLEHGTFCAWLASEFALSRRTAERYMRIAEFFAAKCDTLAHLPSLGLEPSAIDLLAANSTPVEVQREVLAKVESGGRVTVKEIRAKVKKAKAADRLVSEEAKLSHKQKQRRKAYEAVQRRRREEEERKSVVAEAARKADCKCLATLLQENLGDELPKAIDLLRRCRIWELVACLEAHLLHAEPAA